MEVINKGATPGVWTSDYNAARAAALSASKPCIVVVCNTDGRGADCSRCLKLEASVFSAPALIATASQRGWYLAYLQTSTPGYMSYTAGASGGAGTPYVSVFSANGLLVLRTGYTPQMDTFNGLLGLIEDSLDGVKPVTKPAPVTARKPWWKFWGFAVACLGLAGCGSVPSLFSSRNTIAQVHFTNSTNCTVTVTPNIEGGAAATPTLTASVPASTIEGAVAGNAAATATEAAAKSDALGAVLEKIQASKPK